MMLIQLNKITKVTKSGRGASRPLADSRFLKKRWARRRRAHLFNVPTFADVPTFFSKSDVPTFCAQKTTCPPFAFGKRRAHLLCPKNDVPTFCVWKRRAHLLRLGGTVAFTDFSLQLANQ